MRMKAFVAIATLFFSVEALAADGSSGCGPAWYIIKENSLLSSFGRYVTNGFLTPIVTLGMTFGTSNCAKHSLAQQDQDSLEFAMKSFDLLRHDIAKAEGEHLAAYITSFDCQPLVTSELASALQKAFRDGLSKSQDPADFVSSTRYLIQQSATHSRMCS